MSRDAEDEAPRPRPGGKPKRRPAPDSSGDPRQEPSTFRPAPKRNGAGTRSSRSRGTENEPISAGPGWMERILFGRVSSGQLAQFCRQFAAYLDAGVDILKALTSLELQFSGSALGPVLGRLKTSVRQGNTMAETVALEPQAFDAMFVSMIKVAEARGGLPETFHRLSEHYEARQSLIRQARSAMIYPLAVIIVASGVIALITVWLLPKFADMLRDIAPRVSLPLASRLLMGFSSFIAGGGWWMIPLVMIGVPVMGFQLYRTQSGKRVMDEVAMYVPVLGQFLKKIDTSRFARTLSVLMGAGVDVNTSLDLTAGVMQSDPFRRAVLEAKRGVMDGDELSEAIDQTGRFNIDVVTIINSGEETGRLPESLVRVADDYEEQVAYMVKNLGQLIQPLLLILLGGVVLFIILAVFLPYISLLTNLSNAAGS